MLHKLIATLRKRGAHGRVFPVQAAEAAQAAELISGLVAQRDELLAVTQGFRMKLATYVSVYAGDKELRRLLDTCDAAIAKATGEQT